MSKCVSESWLSTVKHYTNVQMSGIAVVAVLLPGRPRGPDSQAAVSYVCCVAGVCSAY